MANGPAQAMISLFLKEEPLHLPSLNLESTATFQ